MHGLCTYTFHYIQRVVTFFLDPSFFSPFTILHLFFEKNVKEMVTGRKSITCFQSFAQVLLEEWRTIFAKQD